MNRRVITVAVLAVVVVACGPPRGTVRTRAPAPAVASAPELQLSPQARAMGPFLRGEVAFQEGDFDAALEAYERAAKLDPNEPRLRARLAHLHLRQGDLERAREEAAFAVSRRPDDVETRMILAGTLMGLGQEKEAGSQYEEVVELDPADDEAYLYLASVQMKQGQSDKARVILEKLLAENSNSVMGYYYLGRLHTKAGRLDDAREQFKQALRRNSRSALILGDLALVEEMRGDPRSASTLYRRILAVDPDNELAHRRIAALASEVDQREAAVKEFRRTEQIEADPTETRLKIGLIHLEKGDYERAATELNLVRATESKDTGDPVSYYLGIVYSETGELARAREMLEEVPPESALYPEAQLQLAFLAQRDEDLGAAVEHANAALAKRPDSTGIIEFLIAVERDRERMPAAVELAERLVETAPQNDRYRFMLGALYDESGDRPAALAEMRRSIEINGENAAALNYLGYSLAEEGRDLDEAEDLILRALAVDPNDGFYIDSLGWVYYQRGEYARAVEQLERAVELTGDDPTINEHLADAYRMTGRELEALQLYREALAGTADTNQKRRLEGKVHAVEQAGGRIDPSL